MRIRHRLVLGMAITAAVLSGCSSAGDDAGKVASAGGSSSAVPAPGDGGGFDQKTKDQMLARAKCMRENGVNIPDPTFEGGMAPREMIPEGVSEEAYKKATDACVKFMPDGGSKEDQAKALDKARAMAKCLREHGIDTPDPDETHGLQIGKPGDDPKVLDKAMKECGIHGG
ncbi:hypothetical protein AB5J62_05850 [Amycolatopsis sp. cg5]|uniref:hypothetical protein n=1 Tax=Amycolatopsis sp. cg5 TaxID=3238802 RepID=UPI003525E8D8